MENIEKRLKGILIDYGIDRSKISKDSDYYFDLNLDILDLMGLAKKIKKEFLISIPENEILRMERISDTIYFLEKKSRPMFLHN
ncbi:MAG: hypothetical protein GQ564_11245 [Bacteroidales bacterium]|nr:hypothetical protein [Bacteroidales bacterium]